MAFADREIRNSTTTTPATAGGVVKIVNLPHKCRSRGAIVSDKWPNLRDCNCIGEICARDEIYTIGRPSARPGISLPLHAQPDRRPHHGCDFRIGLYRRFVVGETRAEVVCRTA